VHYEGDRQTTVSDVTTSMYTRPWQVAAYSQQPHDKPYILCEYSHAMGNSNGDIWSYWRPIYDGARYLQGGYIWDWVDQSLRTPVPSSRKIELIENPKSLPLIDQLGTFFSYGGTFGPVDARKSDGNFCANGLVNADRTPHPGLAEVKKVYQPIQMRPGDLSKGEIELQNWHDFRSAEEWLVGSWKLMADGKVLQQGAIDGLSLAPREKKKILIPLKPVEAADATEYFLDVEFKLKDKQPWADAGHEVAWEQFKMPWDSNANAAAMATPPLRVRETDDQVIISGEKFSAIVGKKNGLLMSLKSGDVELLEAPLGPHFWRAPVDNDRGNGMAGGRGGPGAGNNAGQGAVPPGLTVWRKAHETFEVTSFNLSAPNPGEVEIKFGGHIRAVAAPYQLSWTIFGNGQIAVAANLGPSTAGNMPELPRFGMQTTLREGFDNLKWFGKGPQETYWDRQDARVDLFGGKVADQYFDYIKPQETGNKEAVRWIALTDAAGRGLLAIGEPTLSANALHQTTDDLFVATQLENAYFYQLPVRKTVTLNLDYKQRGLGGDNSWGNLPHDEFRLLNPPFSYKYRLQILTGGEDMAAAAKVRVIGSANR
jgi:beta-galactosidase